MLRGITVMNLMLGRTDEYVAQHARIGEPNMRMTQIVAHQIEQEEACVQSKK